MNSVVSFLAVALGLLLLAATSTQAFVSPSSPIGQSSLVDARTTNNNNNNNNNKSPRIGSTKRYFFNFNKDEKEKLKDPETKLDDPAPTTKPPISGGGGEDYYEDDPVEKIFNFFFGQKEEAPLGLKRFGADRFPEQYPATITEWAEPVASDDKEMAQLRPLLKNTNLETRGLKLVYNANRNGWNPNAFHKAVDKKGPSLVVCTTTDGLVCGGYNPKGWVSYGEARGSIAAFLFRFNEDGTIAKLRKVGGASLAQMDMPESGPMFGADSLIIPLERGNPKLARSKLGSYYERFSDGNNSLFRKSSAVQLKELKVYQGVYAPDEFIPFTDAEPFALY